MLTYLWLVNGSLVGWCGSFVGRNRYAVNRSWVDRGWVGRGWVDRRRSGGSDSQNCSENEDL
jgi:hypothetical protein